MNSILYRIYTEDKNRAQLEKWCSDHLDSYTIISAVGRYDGYRKYSLIIEHIGTPDSESDVLELARYIALWNNQGEVIVTKQSIDMTVIDITNL